MNKITKGLFILLVLLTLTGCNNTNNNELINKTVTCKAEGSQYKEEIVLTGNNNKLTNVKTITYYDSDDDMMTKEDVELAKDVFNNINGLKAEIVNGEGTEYKLEIEIDYNSLDIKSLEDNNMLDSNQFSIYTIDKYNIDDAVKELENNHYICNK